MLHASWYPAYLILGPCFFVTHIVTPRHNRGGGGGVEGLISGRQTSHVTFPDQSVWIDENLCALMLENVIVNAL